MALPQTVAAFHALVGGAAAAPSDEVFVGFLEKGVHKGYYSRVL